MPRGSFFRVLCHDGPGGVSIQKLISLGLAIVFAATLASASGPYTYSGAIDATFTGQVIVSAQDFAFTASPGQVITATLTWPDTLQDLDLKVVAPGASCAILPVPEAECIASGVPARVANALCPNRNPVTNANGFESLTFTVANGGVHKISVLAAIAPGTTEYMVTIAVDGAAPAVTGPTSINYIGGSPVCKVP